MQLAQRLEYATDDDPARCYCLWPYERPAPAADKFRAVNLLYQTFDVSGMPEGAYQIVEALRDGIGAFQTVFGIKWAEGRLAWEFYFYDYLRTKRVVSATRVLQALAPVARSEVALNENLPYFMFSLDIDAALASGQRAIDLIHMYVGNPGSAVSSGIAYGVRADSTTLENFYFFFDAKSDMAQAVRKIENSPHTDTSRIALDEILVPELRDCRTLCVANKRTHDCIYFSGVKVDQLLHFLRRLQYPRSTVDFVQQHRHLLDHLTFDVGFDYTLRDGRLTALKSGFYGVF
jgi:hypothetical protein